MEVLERVLIFLTEKFIVIGISRVGDLRSDIEVSVQGIISVISVYVLQSDLDDSQKDHFCDSHVNVAKCFGEK